MRKTAKPTEIDWVNLFNEINSSRKGLSSQTAESRLAISRITEIKRQNAVIMESLIRIIKYAPVILLLVGIGICFSFSLFNPSLLCLAFVFLFIASIFIVDLLLRDKMLKHSDHWHFAVKVQRDNEWCIKPSREIVFGDVISVAEGDIFPADCILLTGNIQTNDDSIDAKKIQESLKPGHHIARGTQVYEGQATCLVVSSNQLRYSDDILHENNPDSIKHIRKILLFSCLFLICSVSIIVVGCFLTGKPIALSIYGLLCVLVGGMSLPALTIIRANQISVSGLLLKKGIFLKSDVVFSDIENSNILCVDQKGILTHSEHSIVELQTMGEMTVENLLWEAIVTPSVPMFKDFEVSARKKIAAEGKYFLNWNVLEQKKYDYESRISEAHVGAFGEERVIYKGLPLDVLRLCAESEPFVNQAAINAILMYSKKGYKSIGLASSIGPSGKIHMDGVIAFIEPLRQESKRMIDIIRGMDIKPFVLFNDGLDLAVQMAEKIGLGKVKGIGDFTSVSSIYFSREMKEFSGLTGVRGADKLPILNALQSDGERTAITGSRSEDSLALKHADVSIVPESSVPAIRGIATVQLKDYRLESITNLFSDCRRLFQRIQAWSIHETIRSVFICLSFIISFFFFSPTTVSLSAMSYLGMAHLALFIAISQDVNGIVHSRKSHDSEDFVLLSFGIVSWLLIQFMGLIIIGTYVFQLKSVEMSSIVFINMLIISQASFFFIHEFDRFLTNRPGKNIVAIISVLIILGIALSACGIFGTKLTLFGFFFAGVYSVIALLVMHFLKIKLQAMLKRPD